MTCDLCAARSYVYDDGCLRCVARGLARTPRRFSGEVFQSWAKDKTPRAIEEMRALRANERELEVKDIIARAKQVAA